MYYFDDLLEDIETGIDGELDVEMLAQRMNLSVYEFRRVFSFVTKLSFGDYVRRRRLSRAALELHQRETTIAQLAERYGYDTPSSFSRAFKEFHGVTPSQVQRGETPFRVHTRLRADITTTGGVDVTCRLVRREAFSVTGYWGHSTLEDTECCEDVWEAFYRWDEQQHLTASTDTLYAVYLDGDNGVDCLIGKLGTDYPHTMAIPAGEWACFTLTSTQDEYVNAFYSTVLAQWLSSVNYVKNPAVPNIEVYPVDMGEDGFAWEIWIPVNREE